MKFRLASPLINLLLIPKDFLSICHIMGAVLLVEEARWDPSSATHQPCASVCQSLRCTQEGASAMAYWED